MDTEISNIRAQLGPGTNNLMQTADLESDLQEVGSNYFILIRNYMKIFYFGIKNLKCLFKNTFFYFEGFPNHTLYNIDGENKFLF